MTLKLQSWITELRMPFLTATVVSIILGTSVAWVRNSVFNLGYFLLALVGGIFLHVGTNVANDYFDHKSKNDEINKEFIRPFSGGSRTIQMGLLTPREVLLGALVFFFLGTLVGLYLTLTRGAPVLFLGLIGVTSGFFYTAPPLQWANRGVGETLVGLNFGGLMTLGAYYVQTTTFMVEPLLASIPTSLLIAAVLYINEFQDYQADRAVGKKTLVVRLGRDKAVTGYAFIVLAAYAAIFISAVMGITPQYTLIALVSLPLAIEAVQHARKFHSDSLKLVPSNALTIVCHSSVGILTSLSYLLHRFESMGMDLFLINIIIGLCISLTAFFYLKVKLQKHLEKAEM